MKAVACGLRVGLHQRRGADTAGSASNFLMILLGSTPMAWATSTNSATSSLRAARSILATSGC